MNDVPTGKSLSVFYGVLLEYSLMAQLKSVSLESFLDLWNGSK